MKQITDNEKKFLFIAALIIIAVWCVVIYGDHTGLKKLSDELDSNLKVITAKASAQNLPVVAAADTASKIPAAVKPLKNPFINTLPVNPDNIGAGSGASDTALAGGQLSMLKLTGVMNTKDNKYAIINDNIVKEGMMIFGAVVVKISDRQVILKQMDQLYYLEMPKPR